MSWARIRDSKGERFVAMASDIEAYMVARQLYPKCPICRNYLTREIFTFPRQVGDEPEAVYDFVHSCGAVLLIYND